MTPELERKAMHLMAEGKSIRQTAEIIGVDKGQVERLRKRTQDKSETSRGARYVRKLTRKAERSLMKCLDYLDKLTELKSADGESPNIKVADAVIKGAKVAADIVDGWEPEVAKRYETPPEPTGETPEGDSESGAAKLSLLRRAG